MPSVTKRGDTYRIMVSLGYGMDGRQIRKTTTFTPPEGVTEGKARKLAEAYAHDYEKRCRGVTNLGENMKFHELAEWYYREIAPKVLKPRTIYHQGNLLDTHIMKTFGHLKLKDITTARIDEHLSYLSREGGVLKYYALIDKDLIPLGQRGPFARRAGIASSQITVLAKGGYVWLPTAEKVAATLEKPVKELFYLAKEKKELSSASIENVTGIMSAIFRVAVKKGIVEKNPVLNATPPKRVKDSDRDYLDDNQCRKLLAILPGIQDRQFALMIETLLFTGLRAGELCALHWSDLDLDAGKITIRHSLTLLKGVYTLDKPKTKTSERVVNISSDLADKFKCHKEAQEKHGAGLGGLGGIWNHQGQVFTNQTGGYHSLSFLNGKFKRMLKKHGFPAYHIHDLRH
ncbi:MAG: tyrosine-type recombinase/integrase, partial [Clostridiales bacterium]|nr:tyrosine-type recombinase/integrase [Clostridiales bacterium]